MFLHCWSTHQNVYKSNSFDVGSATYEAMYTENLLELLPDVFECSIKVPGDCFQQEMMSCCIFFVNQIYITTLFVTFDPCKNNLGQNVVEHQDVSAPLKSGDRNILKKGQKCRVQLVRGPRRHAPPHGWVVWHGSYSMLHGLVEC